MSWLDDIGLGQLWDRISAIFARKTEAGGSFTFDGGTIYLIAVAGGTLDSENLDTYFANHDEAVSYLGLGSDGHTLYAYDVNGHANGNGIDIASASGASSINYGRYISYNSRTKVLTLTDQSGNYLDSTTLE